ncbi:MULTISPECIES: Asp23/Gls24 family envelope stress response protein [Streptomyces]|uniref:Asp23/Gls24 family envelope stress response protein n=1 Tax=Streptomyces TaxID=1883 RepID=UPI000CD55DD5|nr:MULTISPECIES: Asp23/Gls24 family envelope stress response protein [Streptomyces]
MATSTAPGTASNKSDNPAAELDRKRPQNQSATTVSAGHAGVDEPAAERGKTSIADGVVEKIAGMAAREVTGVYALGGSLARTLGAVRDRVPGGRNNVSRGVKAEVGQKQTAIDLDVVIDYGVPIQDVSEGIRENVIGALERMTGLEVVEVNITVNDVHLPEDDEEEEPETARVQ